MWHTRPILQVAAHLWSGQSETEAKPGSLHCLNPQFITLFWSEEYLDLNMQMSLIKHFRAMVKLVVGLVTDCGPIKLLLHDDLHTHQKTSITNKRLWDCINSNHNILLILPSHLCLQSGRRPGVKAPISWTHSSSCRGWTWAPVPCGDQGYFCSASYNRAKKLSAESSPNPVFGS